MTESLEIPVAMIVFNRADRARAVFERVRNARPRRLYVIADGPRAAVATDPGQCEAARAIADEVDWNCEVVRDFADSNLGCGGRILSGLDRVFAENETAIVLEDDCLPHQSFFGYCAEALTYYADDGRVFAVTGAKYPCEPRTHPRSYRFTRMFNGWGWGGWRRAWQSVDWEMKEYPAFRDSGAMDKCSRSRLETEFFMNGFEKGFTREIERWDWALMFAAYRRGQVFLTPDRNLISNTGWGADATQSRQVGHILGNLPTYDMELPLRHPPEVAEDVDNDSRIYWMVGPLTGPRYARSIKKRRRRARAKAYLRDYTRLVAGAAP